MSIKDIQEAIDNEKVLFGISQCLKHSKDKKPKIKKVFVAKDTRPETIETLEKHKIAFQTLKEKETISTDLGLNFETEVISLI
jgi:ribosomal protein L7Ae-like RNA K-turn-binding protein